MSSQHSFAFVNISWATRLSEIILKSDREVLGIVSILEMCLFTIVKNFFGFREKFCKILPQHECKGHHIGIVSVSSSLKKSIPVA